MSYSTMTQLVRSFLEGPLTRWLLMRWRRKQFLSSAGFGCYFGAYSSFEEARQYLPPSPGFDEEALTEEHVTIRTNRIFAYDYPMLWWLSSAFGSGAKSILDIGGSVGVHFYAYRPWLRYPPELRWTIVEVPAVERVGRRLAAEREATSLDFCTDLLEAVSRTGASIWISAGALQYLAPPSLSVLLHTCSRHPGHILLNKLPLFDGDDFVSAQNLGESCFSPVHIFNRVRFVESILAEGYVLKDQWAVYERSFYLPGYPERSFPCFTGLYFVADES
ncbi:putative methyltransferase, LIC12133 family [Variovorax sp. HW608]|uniref:methyltransferase, TIGR04325 family n=1 Tax=Variovorax sp. HW608 TaxID=1034889 RepID=UPI00081FEE43|nr:methyltransferase, TIGR04325 family [Variovorax sp. HW608]SCK17107.1 putative methyltransferase, LIC12133 family [Variovorax sp. HW608]